MIDTARGLFDLVWIGADGREKRVRYERPDANRVVVQASVTEDKSGLFAYDYTVENLKTSGQPVSGFAVQTFAQVELVGWEAPLARMASGLLGPGQWWRFVFALKERDLAPGQTARVRLISPAPPGVVNCAVDGGSRVMKGVGEEIPHELQAALSGYEAWPRGITIGPDETLRALTSQQRITRLSQWIPAFREAGWISMSVREAYERILREAGLTALAKAVTADVQSGVAAPEVAAVIQTLVR